MLIREVILNNKIFEKLSPKEIEIILQCCQTKLSPDDYFNNGDKYGDLFYNWRNAICAILHEILSEQMLIANISSLQEFFE